MVDDCYDPFIDGDHFGMANYWVYHVDISMILALEFHAMQLGSFTPFLAELFHELLPSMLKLPSSRITLTQNCGTPWLSPMITNNPPWLVKAPI